MNTEQLARHLEMEMTAIPAGSGSVENVIRNGRRRRRVRRLAGGAGALILGFLFVMFPIPYDPNPAAIAGSYEIPAAVEISDLEVAVETQMPATENPQVWIGWKHPAPEFDTSDLGADFTFDSQQLISGDLGDRVLSAVYLGESDGHPFYIYAVDPPSIYDRSSEILSGNLSGEILGTSHGCCSGGDMDIEEGLPGLSTYRAGETEPIVTAEWLGLAPDISVVAIAVDGTYVGWQTPVGGVMSMRLDHEPGAEVSLVAFTTDGEEVRRFGPWEMGDLDGPPGSSG